jgi:transaldolase/glucose-6-phosphate isomerase
LKRAYEETAEAWRKNGSVRRLWDGDKSLWTGADEDKWLGWLSVVAGEMADITPLMKFAEEVQRRGYRDFVLLGMGGSSLGPEVLAETFGTLPDRPRFHILDSTDPSQIAALERSIDLAKTLFIVSSKSGSTLEPNIFMEYFLDRVRAVRGRDKLGEAFVAVTDPGSSLEKHAKEIGFAHIFYGVPSIGGRYSVLSNFGLVPAAAMGLDLKRFLGITQQMVNACAREVPPAENPGVQLGLALGIAASQFGRDKVTILASPGIADLGAWLEQLLAESTGKQGRGLIPLTDEPMGAVDAYGQDRFFACLELEGEQDDARHKTIDALAQAGHPVVRIRVKDRSHLGQEFFRWEIATAVAGAVIGINPFDQPDVEASKVKTRALTDAYKKSKHLPEDEPIFRVNGIALYADPRNAAELGRHSNLADYLKSHFKRIHAGEEAGDYAAMLAYIERNEAHVKALTDLRAAVRDHTHAATCLGFGPRFQHSTGQAYKGGPNSGVFLQITCDDPVDLDVPGYGYTFSTVKAAQAKGDLDVLVERGRRALRVHLANADGGLAELAKAAKAALLQEKEPR